MGETSGYLVDPKSARAVLEVLADHLDFSIDYEPGGPRRGDGGGRR